MPKKIYDIKPPKVARRIEKDIKDFLEQPKVKRIKRVKKEEVPVLKEVAYNVVKENVVEKPKKLIRKNIFIGLVSLLVVLFVYLFFTLPKAEIIVFPKIEKTQLEQKITADEKVESVNSERQIIPAYSFEVTKNKSQNFPTTGIANDEGKSSGKITIYNKYEPFKSFTFIAGTRFISDSGKLFLADEKVTVPAAKKVNGKVVPGSVVITVSAAEGGPDYNIPPSNFSVPGLKGTASYFSISAVSETDMNGGYSGNVKKVTADDLQTAENTLKDQAEIDAINAVKNQISSEYVLLDNSIVSRISETKTKIKANDVAENFDYLVSVKASALAFKKADIDQLVKEYVNSQIAEGRMLLEKELIIDYSSSVIDISGGLAKLNLKISSGHYLPVDSNSLSLLLLNKNERQIIETIKNSLKEEPEKIEVKFWPFWVKSSPGNQKAVNVSVSL